MLCMAPHRTRLITQRIPEFAPSGIWPAGTIVPADTHRVWRAKNQPDRVDSIAANSIRLTFWKVFSRNCGRGADLKNADTSPDFPGFSRIFGACDFLWGHVFLQGKHKKVAFSEKNTFFAQNTLSRLLVESFLRQTARAPPNAPGPCAYVRWAVIWRVRKKPSHMSHAQHGD